MVMIDGDDDDDDMVVGNSMYPLAYVQVQFKVPVQGRG